MKGELSGGCLCGAVRYVLREGFRLNPYACHCTDCQSRTGSAFSEHMLFALADLALPPPPEHQISSPSPGATRRGVSRTVAYTFGWSRSDESNEVTERGFERAPVLSCSCLTDWLLSL